MSYKAKLTTEALKELRKNIGFDAGRINLNNGLIEVTSKGDLWDISEKYNIQNIPAYLREEDKKKEGLNSLKVRRKIIGDTIEIGSIVIAKLEEGLEHIVIIGINDDNYIGAKILLQDLDEDSNNIHLQKNTDVIYRNLKYKQIVTVVNQKYTLKSNNFVSNAGGAIIGKVVNKEVLDKIILWNENSEYKEEKTISTELLSFEEMVSTAKNVEDIIDILGLKGYYLADLVRGCIENNTRSMKVLLPIMQKKLLQNIIQREIAEMIKQSFNNWLQAFEIEMQEYSISYFLKVIQKQLKGK